MEQSLVAGWKTHCVHGPKRSKRRTRCVRHDTRLSFPTGFPLVGKTLGGEFANQLALFQHSAYGDRFVFLEVKREAQFAVNPFAIANRSRAGVIRISGAGDSRAINFESKTCRSFHVVNVESDVPLA